MVEEIAQGKQPGPVDVRVDGPAQVNFRKITLPPGASTGRHCHYGQLVGVVESGTLTHYARVHPGGVHVYKPGDSVVEGSGYIHEGRNEGTADVVLWVTYVTPKGKPLAEPDLGKCASPR
ncbi:cupin domain-containing protein [Streptomyces pathocidini]|uniref:Cupin domain-containing protein n=1 Tax=Streptomyces pathocidini TaxID=1650571 RepID=A0ABW7UZF1_9ACTN